MVTGSAGRNLTQQMVHNLGVAIVRGDYSPQARFPSEAELCEQYAISRSATREAIKMLTAKGLLSSRPRQGIRILSKDQWNLFDPDVLSWVLQSTPSRQMLTEFLQLRLAIEPEAAALAAEHRDVAAIDAIHTALARMQAAENGLDDALEADIEFHSSLLIASKNPFFRQMRSFIATALRVSIRYTNRIKGVTMANTKDHKKIYDAIRRGSAESARRAAKALLIEALTLINTEKSKG